MNPHTLSLVPNSEYLPDLARLRAQKESQLRTAKDDNVRRMMADLELDRARNPNAFRNDRWGGPGAGAGAGASAGAGADAGVGADVGMGAEEEEDDDDDGDADDQDLIDRSEERGPSRSEGGEGEYIDLTQVRSFSVSALAAAGRGAGRGATREDAEPELNSSTSIRWKRPG
jgi:hypothetical protein